MLPISDLTNLDYEILETLALVPMPESALINSFPSQSSVKHRIQLLMDYDYDDSMVAFGGVLFPKSDTYYIQHSPTNTDLLELSAHGLKAWDDWKWQKKRDRQKILEDRAWKIIPIVISISALIVATISLLQALHWIDLAR